MQSKNFRDFDAFAASVGDVDCSMTIQNTKMRRWEIAETNVSGIHVQLGRLGSGNIVEGESHSNGYLLYMPLTKGVAYLANGIGLDKNSFAILEPGCDFCVSTKVEHDWCSIFIPKHKFARGGDPSPMSSGLGPMTCRVTRTDHRIAERFRSITCRIMTAAANCSQLESSVAAEYAAAELLTISALVVGQQFVGRPHHDGRPKIPRQEIIGRTKEFLEQREGNHVDVGELAAAAEVSERTLRTAFNEFFGVGPVRYLQLRQLNQVYRALRAAGPDEASVGSVLVRHGVWAFSRFAKRYRQLFDELPSETLRAKTP